MSKSPYKVYAPIVDEYNNVRFERACVRPSEIKAIAEAAVRHGYAMVEDGQDNRQIGQNYFFGSELEAEVECKRKLANARTSYPSWVEKQCFVHASWA